MEGTPLPVAQKRRRTRLFSVLEAILDHAEEKRKTVNLNDKTKQAWSRISIAAISTYGALLHDADLDDINLRLEKLEQQTEEPESK